MSFKKSADILKHAGIYVQCRICGDELVPAGGFIKVGGALSFTPLGVVRAESVNRFFAFDGQSVYVSADGKSFSYLNALAGDDPFVVEELENGAARAAAVCGKNAVLHDGSSFVCREYGANLKYGVMHSGRLFGADVEDGLALRWSGAGGVCDWARGVQASGYVRLDPERGEIIGINKLGDKLVAVRRYGLTVLSAYGNCENFRVEATDTDCDEIYRGTAGVAGGRLWFCTVSGLKYFDGERIRTLGHPLAKDVYSPESAVCFSDKYFLICKSRFKGGKTVLCVDAEGESFIADAAASALCAADGLYAYCDDGVFKFGTGARYELFADGVNFGSGGYKTLTGIFVDGSADIEISNGRVTRGFSGASGKIRPRLRGKNFCLRITGDGAVRKITAVAEVRNEL